MPALQRVIITSEINACADVKLGTQTFFMWKEMTDWKQRRCINIQYADKCLWAFENSSKGYLHNTGIAFKLILLCLILTFYIHFFTESKTIYRKVPPSSSIWVIIFLTHIVKTINTRSASFRPAIKLPDKF